MRVFLFSVNIWLWPGRSSATRCNNSVVCQHHCQRTHCAAMHNIQTSSSAAAVQNLVEILILSHPPLISSRTLSFPWAFGLPVNGRRRCCTTTATASLRRIPFFKYRSPIHRRMHHETTHDAIFCEDIAAGPHYTWWFVPVTNGACLKHNW
jgi:hypothetical protein